MEIFKWGSRDVSRRLFRRKRCPRFSVSPAYHRPHWQDSNSIFSVESTPNVGNAFTSACKDWREGTFENFKDWAVKQFGFEELDSEDEADPPVDAQKAKNLKFFRNEKGDFIVPKKSDFKLTKQRQRVIRGYIGAVYSQYTHSFFDCFFWLEG